MIKKSLKILSKLPRQTLLPTSQFSLPFYSQRFSFCSSKEDLNKPEIKLEITSENVNEIVDKWVKENKVVLFMKGVPQMPQCGYSNFVVQVLQFYKITDYKGVDILKNVTLREGVKKYSNWPTYPQLYVDGKLIGGCDIVNEMHKEGTLRDVFVQAGIIE